MSPTTLLLLQAALVAQSGAADSAADSVLIHADGTAPVSITAALAVVPPALDGILDDAVWQIAELATGFRRDNPGDGEPAAERTEVQVSYTRSALYVGARMYDRDPSGISRLRGRRDSFAQQNDQFLVQIDSYHDHRTAFIFGVTPAGGRNDVVAPNDGLVGMDTGWDPVWEVATQIDSLGWTAEIRIPFSQLRFPEGDRQVWGINFRRDILRAGEAVDWAWRPATEAGWTSQFGHLLGLEGIPRPGRLEVLPYAVARTAFDQRADPASPFDDGSLMSGSMGVDLKYGLTSGLTLDATINPDFGQVEADPAVVNLTAFETFFQERRPFFVEGSGIFEFGGLQGLRFFYSRRVGQRPAVSALGSAAHVDQPKASTILGAAKLSGKTESGWAIGLLNTTTQRESARLNDGATFPVLESPVDPLTNTTALRVRKDLNGGASYVGLIGTGVARELGDPEFNGLRDRALVGGVDFLHRFRNRTFALQGWAGASYIHGGPEAIVRAQSSSARYYQRPDQDYVNLDPNRTSLTGFAGELSFRKESGEWLYGMESAVLSPGFEMNDAGFQTVADVFNVVINGTRRWLQPSRFFRSANVGVVATERRNFGNTPTLRQVSFNAGGQTLGFRRLRVSGVHGFQVQDPLATRGGPTITNPSTWTGSVFVGGDARNQVSGNISANYTEDAEGSFAATVAPSLVGRGRGWFSWSLRPRFTKSSNAAFYVTQADDADATATFGRRYVFAELEQTSLDLTARMDMALTPRMTLQVYAQPFVATGDYERFAALSEAGTFAFDRYGEDGSTIGLAGGVYSVDADGAGPAETIQFRDPDFRLRSFRSNVVLRWEYLPGSTLFVVWSQDRADRVGDPAFDGIGDLKRLFSDPMRNVLLLKASYWLDF
ncbi:MAG: DUF5916 domain-containing protein [Longimicrobiales bacterium]